MVGLVRLKWQAELSRRRPDPFVKTEHFQAGRSRSRHERGGQVDGVQRPDRLPRKRLSRAMDDLAGDSEHVPVPPPPRGGLVAQRLLPPSAAIGICNRFRWSASRLIHTYCESRHVWADGDGAGLGGGDEHASSTRPGDSVIMASVDTDRPRQRQWMAQWRRAGAALERVRAQELARLDSAAALAASEALLSLAPTTPLPDHRVSWSGLIALQRQLHGKR